MATTSQRYIVAIDTDSYAGNFERQLCAYATGHVGECGVGAEEAEDYENSTNDDTLFRHIQERDDDNDDCPRPVAITETPGWFNDGVGNHYRDGADERIVLAKWKAESAKYEEKWRDIKEGYRARLRNGERVANWTEDAIDREVARHNAKIAEILATTRIHKWPAYNSVGIFFGVKPTERELAVIKERAERFCTERYSQYGDRPRPCIEGYRLIIITTQETREEIPF